jgi:hypothetical protein
MEYSRIRHIYVCTQRGIKERIYPPWLVGMKCRSGAEMEEEGEEEEEEEASIKSS